MIDIQIKVNWNLDWLFSPPGADDMNPPIEPGDYLTALPDDYVWFEEGDLVTDGRRIGVVRFVGLSPYWGEERNGVHRAYVMAVLPGESWADHILLDDLYQVDAHYLFNQKTTHSAA